MSLAGNLVISVTAKRLAEESEHIASPAYVIGFENHGGRTQLDK